MSHVPPGDQIVLSNGVTFTNGEGSPEGVVTAVVGSIYSDRTNGILYIKETGSGNTGWAEVGVDDPLIVTGLRFATAGRSSSMDPDISAGGTFNNLTIWKSVITVAPPGGGATVTGILWDDDESDIALPFVFFFNTGTGNVTFTDEGAGSTASNRFALIGSSSVVIPPRGGALLMKVNMPAPIGDTRWVIVARSN